MIFDASTLGDQTSRSKPIFGLSNSLMAYPDYLEGIHVDWDLVFTPLGKLDCIQ
jgi:hypothetical protein